MKIALLQTGKTSEKYLSAGITIYEKRIKKYSSFEILTVPDLKNTKNMSADEQKEKEGEHILRFLKGDDYIVFLHEKGKELSTNDFSRWFEKILMLRKKRIVFVIGGPWGFSAEVLKRANAIISLSQLTFSHQIVRLLFLEQLYRAFTIIKGEPYHHN